jgi:predicted  nucleic acid-binding Zn-ribbon protein
MSQPFKLYRLQQLDSQLDAGRDRLREVEMALQDDRELRQAISQVEKASQEVYRAQKKQQNAEYEVNQQRIKIEQTESTLYGGKVRNPKELQDLQNELAALKRYLAVLEDRQLEAMLEEEGTREEEEALRQELATLREKHALKLSSLEEERDRLVKEIANREEERQAAVATISQADSELYEQLRRDRRGLAVARVSDKACSACGTTLSAMLLQAARSTSQITRCDTCGRILYVG